MEITKNKEKELYITHLFNAPVEMVFQAWTDPKQLTQWYAPEGCSISYKHLNIKENGNFHSCIHDPVHGETGIHHDFKQ